MFSLRKMIKICLFAAAASFACYTKEFTFAGSWKCIKLNCL